MAVEAKRGCGFRKIGGLYLVGDFSPVDCDRMPYLIGPCPVCGGGLHFTRSMTEINPLRLFGFHDPCAERRPHCKLCQPPDDAAFVMTVGNKYYTPESFIQEAATMGVSKRIPFIPKKLVPGHTIIYLAHPKAVPVHEPSPMSKALVEAVAIVEGEAPPPQPRLLEADQVTHKLGIFCAFIPQGIEKVLSKKNATRKEVDSLKRRGITAVVVPDNDPDHR